MGAVESTGGAFDFADRPAPEAQTAYIAKGDTTMAFHRTQAASARPGRGLAAWWQALPLSAVFIVFFVIPLALVLMVSFWHYDQYPLIPGFTFENYLSVFEGCGNTGDWCVTLRKYA